MKRVAILQSNYLPWKGYFDIIGRVDEFILFDCVQYTKGDWRNRNQIKTAQGKHWLTVPVRREHLGQAIDEVGIGDPGCFGRHWSTFRQSYAGAACIDYCVSALEPTFLAAAECPTLSEVNRLFLQTIKRLLGIDTPLSDARDYRIESDRNERLVSLCRQAGADRYVSGPAARSYIDEGLFEAAGIDIEWMDYSQYPEYPQPHPPFDHQVSILDLLACTGERAIEFIRRTQASQP